MFAKLDKNLGIPVYKQLKSCLITAIRNGELEYGKRIPSENELSRHFGIHRHTVRNTLHRLAEEGIIHSVPGNGWFVAEEKKQLRHVFLINSPQVGSTRGSVFKSRFQSGFSEAAAEYGFLLHTVTRAEMEAWLSESAGKEIPSALILADYRPGWEDFLHRLKATGIPLLIANRQVFGESVPCFAIDQYFGTRDLVTRLTTAGHRKIGCITSELPLHYISERLRGYCDALAAAGIENDPALICYIPNAEEAYERIYDFLKKQPDLTGLFIAGEVFHQAVLDVLHEQGKTIPGTLSVVAFDAMPDITSLDQPLELLAKRLLRSLAELLNGEKITGEVLSPVLRRGDSIRVIEQNISYGKTK